MLKLLIISVTNHMPQNRVSDIVMHVILNIINNVVDMIGLLLEEGCSLAYVHECRTFLKDIDVVVTNLLGNYCHTQLFTSLVMCMWFFVFS